MQSNANITRAQIEATEGQIAVLQVDGWEAPEWCGSAANATGAANTTATGGGVYRRSLEELGLSLD